MTHSLAPFAVSSSMIQAYGYDPKQQILHVQFNNGKVYRYLAVPQHAVDALKAAPSFGSHFNVHIKPNYISEQVPTV